MSQVPDGPAGSGPASAGGGIGSDRDGQRWLRVDATTVVVTLVTVHVVSILSVAVPPGAPTLLVAPPVVFALTFVPGGLLALALFEDWRLTARTTLYAVGLSLSILLGVGFVINLLLPVVGVVRPLAPLPFGSSVTAVVLSLAAAVLWRRRRESLAVPALPLLSPAPLALATLPPVSILAVEYLNRTGDNRPLLMVLAVLAVVPLVGVLVLPERWHPLAVPSLALAVMYHKTFWKNFGFSGSPGVIRAWEARRWSPGVTELHPYSTELLQNGVLFPGYALLSGVSIVTELEVINPFLVAFVPLAVFVAVREYFDSRSGLLAASLFVFAHPFYIQYPTAGRAATPVLFLALFALVMSDADRSRVVASALGLTFASGIVVTHYGTSYFVMIAVLGALGLVTLLHVLDSTLDSHLRTVATDGGGAGSGIVPRSIPPNRTSVLSTTMGLFYSVGATGWYLYATGGNKFETLPRHVVRSIRTLLGEQLVSGRTSARVVRDYGSTSIRLSKVLYVTFGLLMGIGFLYVYYRRVVEDDRSLVDDRYLALATLMLALFGSTFVARNWGGGRPMMITFTLTAGFSVLGAVVVARVGRRAERPATGSRLPGSSAGPVVFAVLLMVLFGLNSGLVSAVAFGGQSPSNVPWPRVQESDRAVDNAGHVWVNDHVYGNVYGDPITHGQTDWRLPAVELRSTRDTAYGDGINKPRGRLLQLLEAPGIEPGYVLLLSHNVESGLVRSYRGRETAELSGFDRELDRRNRLYSSGFGAVYYASEPAGNRTG